MDRITASDFLGGGGGKLGPEVAALASVQPETVARLMASFRSGDHEAAGRLVELFYPELRRIAAARMRAERADQTLQMKQLLIHHARPLSKQAEKIDLPDLSGPDGTTAHSLVEIDDVLNRLAAINPALRRVVELRVFEGLTREEIAREMSCGTATVARHWSFARNWLEQALAGTTM